MYYKTFKIIMAYFFRLVGIVIILLLCYGLLNGGWRALSSVILPGFSVLMIAFFFFWLADKTINEKEDK